MSGDAKKKGKGSAAKSVKGEPTVGGKAGSKQGRGGDDVPQKGARLCTRLAFYLLFVAFGTVVAVNVIDYKTGQLKEAYVKHVPVEVRGHLETAGEKARVLGNQAAEHFWIGYDTAMRLAREYTKGVKIGDMDLGEALFPEEGGESEEDRLRAQEALRKVNEAVKKKEEEAKRKAEEEAKRKAEEAKKTEEEARKKAEEAKKKAEETKRKAEEDARKKAEEAKKKSEEEAKRKAEEAKKKADEEAKKAEESKKKAEEEAKKKAEEAKRKAEEEAKKKTAEAKKKAEEEAKKKADLEKERIDKLKQDLENELEITEQEAAESAKRVEEQTKQAQEAINKVRENMAKKREEEVEKKIRESQERNEEAKKRATEEVKKKKAEEKKARKEADMEKRAQQAMEKELVRDDGEKIAAKKVGTPGERKKAKDSASKEDRLDAAREAAKVAKDAEAKTQASGEAASDPEYSKAGITGADDKPYVADLDRADAIVKSDPEKAKSAFENVIKRSGNRSPRALYGKARALDQLSEKKKSNELLEQSIEAFKGVLEMGAAVPDDLFRMAGVRCVERMQFRGWSAKAVNVLQKMIARFPFDSKLRNDLGVQYLLIGHNKYAKEVFEKECRHNPDNGFAAVHLGFVLKTEGDLEGAVKYLRRGIDSKQEGTGEGKFYYHLGEALQRIGKKEEAEKVFKSGVAAGIFNSIWQRSLYNEDGLKAQPVWTPTETGYEMGLKALQYNWKQIRKEAEAALKAGSFEEEGEGLRDTGRWAQFELYRQGKMTPNCKQAPTTCALVERLPAAKGCTRGQVKFSVMYPGTHVHAHTGPTNCRLRAHLGLSVDKADEEKLRLRVADKSVGWKEGELFIFDDSFEHEVWHEGAKPRLVLIVDLWHPDLSEERRRTLSPI